jgi:uncharacterized membrane protein
MVGCMSKESTTILLVLVVGLLLGFSYLMGKALLDVEKAAIQTMEQYCGPETAKRFKLRGVDCE